MIYAILNMDNKIKKTTIVKSIAKKWIEQGHTVSVFTVDYFTDSTEQL